MERAPSSYPVLLLVRLAGEVSTKSNRTRKRFQRRLAENMRDALESAGVGHRITDEWSRIFVEASEPSALPLVASLFGVSSVSRVDATVPAELDAIVEKGAELYGDRVKGRTYAVTCRRVGEHEFTSRDVKVELGAALNEGAEVDLDAPEVTVSVEVRRGEAYLFSGREEGLGGLPLGVEGKALCLISGGFDSAVAAWLMLKRGISLEYVFCNLGGDAYERSVLRVTKVLADQWSYGDRPRIHVVEFTDVVEALKKSVTPRYWQVVLKRLMYRVGNLVAREVDAEALITGECIGQVSSQTLGNLRAIDSASELPVFRPLIGMEKEEIIRKAEEVGTSALSAQVREYCAILPDKPVTHASPEAADAEESQVDSALLEGAVRERKILSLRDVTPKDLVQPYIFIDQVPEGAVVLDCRPPAHHRAWHFPGARRLDPEELVAGFQKMDKERTYVLYCSYGVETAYVAELMQRAGYEAYSFRGGARSLRDYARMADSPVAPKA